MAADGQIANEKRDPMDLRTVINSTPGLIHTSQPDGSLDFFNEAWLRYVGKPLEDLLGWKWTAFIHPDDVDGIVEKWRASLTSGEPFLYEARVRRADGQYRWMLHHKVALHDQRGEIVKWHGSSIDIEDRKRAEQELRNVIDTIPAIVWVALPDGSNCYVNSRFVEYSGAGAGRTAGAGWRELIHPDDLQRNEVKWRASVASGEPYEIEVRFRQVNGQYRWHLNRGLPLRDADGNIVKWYGVVTDIEDRKCAEEALQQSQFYLSEGQRLGRMGSWTLDPAGFGYWSPELFRIYGLDPDRKAPTVPEYLDLIHPQDRESMANLIKRVLANASPFDATKRIVRPDGEVRHIRCVGAPVVENQSLKKYVGSAIDVTDHERLTQELRRREAYLAEAQRLSHTGSFGWKPGSGEVVWSDETYRIFEYDRGTKPVLDMVVQRVHPDDRALTQQVIDRASQTGTDFEHEYRLLLPDGRVKHVHALAHGVQDTSGNRGFVGAVTDITERKTAEEALRNSEAYLAEAQRLSHTGSWSWSAATGEPRYWSEECYRVLGFEPAEQPPRGEQFFQLVHPDERAAIEEQFYRAVSDKADFEMDTRIVHPIMGIRRIQCIGHAVLDQAGDLREMVGTVIDITERKAAEDKIRRLVNDTILGIVIWNVEGAIVEANEAFLRMVQYSREDLLSGRLRWTDLRPDEWSENSERAMAELKATGTAHPFEREFFRKDGTRVPVLMGGALFQESGNEGVAFVLDLSEQKRAQEALRTSEAYLAEAQRMSHTGSWAWSPDTDVRHWSLECYRVLGFDPRDGLPRTEELIQRIHPDDQPAFRASTKSAKHKMSDEEIEYRIVHPGGAVRDIHSIGHPVFSPSGDLIEFVGTVIDITERKAAEEKIREQEMELRQMLDFTPQIIAVYGSNRERLYANRVALDYLGMSLDEWRQRSFGAEVHPDDLEPVRSFWQSAASHGSAHELEVRFRKWDGSFRWFLVRFNPLHDEKGQIRRWHIACTDIDDRKRAEEKLQLENAALREEIDQTSMFEEIVGTSPALQSVLSRISKVAPSDSTVLITGETGTGKELVARAVHRRSQRSRRAFVSVNCAAIPRDLIASELFGHEKGAFTGALQRRLGRFEMADGGTIFLDEVGELSPETQVALLRVLQERELERVGGGQPIRVDLRVIAATNRNLQAAVADGTFRQDLFYRLNVFPIDVPPLRERKDDIRMLVEYFAQRYASRAGKNIRLIEKKTLELLQCYRWPGNIRELQNVIERSVILSSGEVLSVDEMWLSKQTLQPPSRIEAPVPLQADAGPRSERETIEAALAESRGRVSGPSGAAAKLGIPPSTLDHRIKALGIAKRIFKYG